MVYFSIIIPAYNEEKRIGSTLIEMLNYLSAKNYSWEIILVDDGSTDRTIEVAREIIKDKRLVVLKSSVNSGKGYSVKKGILASDGEVILFSDADLSTPIEELDNMLRWIERGYDIVIGSRALPESVIKLSQPWHRQTMGKIFNLMVRMFVLSELKDTQCGFKCFKRETALKIFNLQRVNGFAFDVEILYIAKKFGLTIREQPVKWINSPDSKVNLFRGPLSMLRELLTIKLYDIKGYYKIAI